MYSMYKHNTTDEYGKFGKKKKSKEENEKKETTKKNIKRLFAGFRRFACESRIVCVSVRVCGDRERKMR